MSERNDRSTPDYYPGPDVPQNSPFAVERSAVLRSFPGLHEVAGTLERIAAQDWPRGEIGSALDASRQPPEDTIQNRYSVSPRLIVAGGDFVQTLPPETAEEMLYDLIAEGLDDEARGIYDNRIRRDVLGQARLVAHLRRVGREVTDSAYGQAQASREGLYGMIKVIADRPANSTATDTDRAWIPGTVLHGLDAMAGSPLYRLLVVSDLLSIGLIKSDTTNNRLYYEVNQSYEFYAPLSQIFGDSKKPITRTRAPADGEPLDIKSIGNVEIALYSGQFTRDNTAGIDVFLVGDINQAKLTRFMSELEVAEGKELRYAAMSLEDFNYRRQIKDRFVANLYAAKKQVLIDKQGLLSA